jgi:DNA-binding transcriptional LysR family regulator
MSDIERIERRLRLQDVRVLMTAVEAGSMGKAAQRLHTSQPAISRAISDLEKALGVPLLDRSPQGVHPTQYARAIIRRGLAIFDELRQGIKDIEFLSDPSAGQLRIGCSESMASGLVLDALEELSRKHPRMSFHVATGAGPPIFEELATRNVELVVSRITQLVSEQYFVVEKLFDDSYAVAASSKGRWARRRKIELADLLREPWTLPPSDSFGNTLIAEAFRSEGLEPPQAIVTTISLSMRNRLLASGRYLTMVPGFAVATDRYPYLKRLPVKLPNTRAPVAVATLRNRTLSPLAQLFLATLRVIAARSMAKSK